MSGDGFNLSIGGDVHGDVAKEIDKSQHQTTNIAGDLHGNVNNAMTGSDYHAKCKEAVGKLLTEIAEATDYPAPDAEVPEPSLPLDEYHPLSLLGEINALADREDPPTDDEATGIKSRLRTMFERVGVAGKKVLVNLGPLAVAGMEASSFMPPPWNIVCPIVKAAVKQFGPNQSSQTSWDQPEPSEQW